MNRDTSRGELTLALTRKLAVTAYDVITAAQLGNEQIVTLNIAEAQMPHVAAHVRAACAIAWDAAVAAMRYEDGAPVEVVSTVNPFREGGESDA